MPPVLQGAKRQVPGFAQKPRPSRAHPQGVGGSFLVDVRHSWERCPTVWGSCAPLACDVLGRVERSGDGLLGLHPQRGRERSEGRLSPDVAVATSNSEG